MIPHDSYADLILPTCSIHKIMEFEEVDPLFYQIDVGIGDISVFYTSIQIFGVTF